MTLVTDDTAPLFDQAGPGVRFRQGTITAWNAATGQNTVDVANGTLTDVPILNTGEAIALKAGHVVGLLGQGMTWFIIGRITPASDEAAVMVVGTCTLINPRPAADFASCAVFIDGVSGPGIQQGFDINAVADHGDMQSMAVSSSRVLAPGGATITCDFQIRSQGAGWAAQSANIAGVSAIATFRSTT